LPLIVWVYLHSNVCSGLRKTHIFRNRVRNGRSRSCKVVDFGINRKGVCDFLLVIKLWATRNILDCDQSNYSSRINFSCIPPSCSVIHESGSDNSFQRYGHSKFSKMAGGRILDLVQPEVGPFDPPSPKTLPRIKHEVDRKTRSRDIMAAILDLFQPEIEIETHSSIFLGWQNINRHKKYISGWNNKDNMVSSIISILMAAILEAILNSAKCSRVPGWHHSDSG